MEAAETQVTLRALPTGTRLLVRSRIDWRYAAISKISDERIVLTVCSPSGRTYRLRREPSSEIRMEGSIPVLINDHGDHWRDNFSPYDYRW